MNDSYIISKMNEYMFQLNQKMGKWLDKSLPQITNNWWQELVLNNLSSLQKDKVEKSNIRNVAGLDLASLLRVFERNWFVITSSFFVNNKERAKIRRMQEIRNDWAHITPQDINKKKVIDDVNVIIELMQTFDASMKETRDMENFIFDIEDDKELKIEPEKKTNHKRQENVVNGENIIQVGSPVTLANDNTAIGAVIAKDGNKYTVLINRVIIFSSFRHTLAYVRNKLQKRGIRVGQVDGTVPDDERYALRQRFLKDREDEQAIDVLLFSEVGCEGLDYQFCDTMINYDLPWNPMRIEQRIGRIDRRGQKSDTVKIYNMITAEIHQREAIFKNMLKNAEDDRIKRMRQSQLDKLTADFEQQKKKIDETIHSVDIYTNLQVKGILHVER